MPHPLPPAIRVLICDDHARFRRALMLMLGLADGIEVVGEAADGIEAVELAMELAPDVILMDLRMPRRNGIAATRLLASQLPSARIVMLTASTDDEDVYEAVKAGASGYLRKEQSTEEVAAAVTSVMAGHSLISPATAVRLLDEPTTPNLTKREIAVLQLVATGRNDRDIAGALLISANTVKNHVRNILDKLHLHSRMEAATYAASHNLIDLT